MSFQGKGTDWANVDAYVEAGQDDGAGLDLDPAAAMVEAEASASHDASKEEWPERPPWRRTMAKNPPPRKPPLIHGLLRLSHVMLITAKGKVGKTYLVVMLAVCVSVGRKWLKFGCEQGRVLIINPEVDGDSFDNRVHDVCEVLGVDPAEAEQRIDVWTTRSDPDVFIGTIADTIDHYVEKGYYSLIVIDSASVFLDGDENKSTDVRRFTTMAGVIGERAGASIVIVHHYGKGDKSDTMVGDRARGSSVWLDGPDAVLAITEVFPQDGDASDLLPGDQNAFVVDLAGQREFKAFEPFHVIHEHPILRLDDEGLTDRWDTKRGGGSDGGKAKSAIRNANKERDFHKYQVALASELMRRCDGDKGIACKEAAEHLGIDASDLSKASKKLKDMFVEYGEPTDYVEGDFSTKAYSTDLLTLRKKPSARKDKADPGKASQGYYIFPRFKAVQFELDLDD